MSYTYKYPRPGLTTDTVAFTILDGRLSVALIKRGIEPFIGSWALPGGYLREHENPVDCAEREMSEETGYNIPFSYLSQLGAYGEPGRDPRGWVVSIAYYALVPQTQANKLTLKSGSDAAEAKWFAVDELPPLAFDHHIILKDAREALKAEVFDTNRNVRAAEIFGFMPEKFTLIELKSVFEVIKGAPIDRGNFYKWIKGAYDLKDTGEKARSGSGPRAAIFEYCGLASRN